MTAWNIVPLQGSLGRYAGAWDELNQRSFGGHPLLTSIFVNGLLHNFSDGAEFLGVHEAGGQVQAMCVLRRKSHFAWASFLPPQRQIAPTLIDDAGLVPLLLSSLPGFVLQLDLLANDPAVGAVVSTIRPPTYRLNHALTVNVQLCGTFDAFWAERPAQLRSNLRRYEKRLIDKGLEARLVQFTSPEQMAAAVARYAQLEGAGWKGSNGMALGASPDQYRFYEELMSSAAQTAQAVVHELWFGDALAASCLSLRHDNMQIMLKTSYDESMAPYAPGRLLLRRVIEDAFSTSPGGSLEFYTDAGTDMLTWATDQRWIQHATCYRWPFLATIIPAVQAYRREAPPAAIELGREERLSRVEVFTRLDALPPTAQDFMDRAERRNIGFGVAWYRNLIATVYPEDSGVRFYVLWKSERVLAVLPLRAKKSRAAWKIGALSNFYTTLYEPILAPGVKSADLVAILSAVQRDFPRFASFGLSPMDPATAAYQSMLGAMRLQGWVPFEYFAFGNWFETLSTNWADYLARRSGTLRSTIKRMSKKFAADGGKLEIITDPKDLVAGIAAYNEVYAASWKRPEEFPDFMPGLLRICAEKGYLRLGLARLNGRPVAAQLWIVSYGRAEIYKLAYHEDFKAYAPGTLVSALLMEHVHEVDKVTEVDYLIGDDPYKKTWVSARRERWGIIAYNPRSLRGLAGLTYESLGRAVKAAKTRLRKHRETVESVTKTAT